MFAFRLALKLGKTVHELLSTISGNELAEWMAYEQIEPFGPLVEDWRAGQVCATVANVQRRQETPAFKADDFMPALREALTPRRAAAVGKDLSADQHAALLDATLFGFTKAKDD